MWTGLKSLLTSGGTSSRIHHVGVLAALNAGQGLWWTPEPLWAGLKESRLARKQSARAACMWGISC